VQARRLRAGDAAGDPALAEAHSLARRLVAGLLELGRVAVGGRSLPKLFPVDDDGWARRPVADVQLVVDKAEGGVPDLDRAVDVDIDLVERPVRLIDLQQALAPADPIPFLATLSGGPWARLAASKVYELLVETVALSGYNEATQPEPDRGRRPMTPDPPGAARGLAVHLPSVPDRVSQPRSHVNRVKIRPGRSSGGMPTAHPPFSDAQEDAAARPPVRQPSHDLGQRFSGHTTKGA
jgi:hypothetical protein